MAPLSLLPPTWSFPWRPLLSPFPWQPSPAMAEFPGSTPTPYSPPWSALELHSSPWRHPLQFPLCLGALPAPFLFSPCVQGALWPAPSNSNRVFFLPCCPRRAANRELSSISPHGRTQQQLAPPLLADAALSHGALQQMPWSIPSMPCDSVSFLRVCCCACTVDACWVLGKMCSSPDVAARLAALCCAANNTPGCPSGVCCFCAAPSSSSFTRRDHDNPCLIPHRRYLHMINCVCVLFYFCFVEERNPVFCVEKKASRSTLVDVRSDAQVGIAIVLTNTDWVCLW
jgi:hypothetical protein